MNNVLKVSKRFFTFSVVITTMLWSMGVAALVPSVANSAICPTLAAGDMVKVTGKPAIYAVNNDLEVLYFPSGDEFKSWRPTYGGYISITQECFDSLAVPSTYPGAVNYHAGSFVVKRPSSDQLYVVEPSNTLAKITTDAATALYGAGYTVMTVSDVFWPHYVNRGADITTAVAHPGMLVSSAGTTYYVDTDNSLREVTSAGITANAFQTKFVNAVAASAISGLTAGVSIDAEVIALTDKTQSGGVVVTPVTPVTPVDGALSVALSANSPAAGNVVTLIDNVVFTKVAFTAGSDADVVINTVVIGRSGLGSVGNFTSVTLYDGATRLGSTRTSWETGDIISYNIPTGWTVPAGTSKELTIVAKLATAATYNALGINSLSLSSGTATGLPVYGNQQTGVAVDVGEVTVNNMGSSATKKIGTSDVNLAEFRLAISSVEDATFNSITLKNKGTAADGDLANIKLYNGATLLADPVSMSSDKITFVLDTPFEIKKSKNSDFKVVGDIVDGDANTVKFLLEYTTDLSVVGKTYNTGVTVVATAYDTVDTDTITITISGADLNIGYTGVTLDTIDDQTDVSLGQITLSTGNTDMKITNFMLPINETDYSGGTVVLDLDNLELVDIVSGATYSGTPGLASASGDLVANDEHWTFTDEIYLVKGVARTFNVRADIPASVNNGDSYYIYVTSTAVSFVDTETVPAGDTVTGFSVGSITGKTVTVKAPFLTIKNIDLNNTKAVVNQTDVIVFKGTITATAGAITLSRMKFDVETGGEFHLANVADVGLFTVDSAGAYTLLQNLTSSDLSDDVVDFNSFSTVIGVGTANRVTFVVKATISATLDDTYSTLDCRVDTITARDADNDTVSAYKADGTTAIADGDELASAGVVTLGDTGVLYVSLRNNDSGFNKDRILLAGEGAWIGKVRLRADYEDVKIIDLKLTFTDGSEEDAVSSVCLYTEQLVDSSKLIGCTTVDSSDVAFFDDINHVVALGTKDVFVYVATNNIGNAATATADSGDYLQFSITTSSATNITARGESSGTDLAITVSTTVLAGYIVFDKDLNGTFSEVGDNGTAVSKTSYIYGSKPTNVQLVSSYGGISVDTVINGTGDYNLAILAITNAANSNTNASGDALKMGIERLSFDVTKHTSTTLSAMHIKRIGGDDSWNAMADATIDGDGETSGSSTLLTVTSTMSTDAFIDAGTTAYFVLRASVSAVGTASGAINWIQASLNDIKGGGTSVGVDIDNNIDWSDGFAAATYLETSIVESIFLDVNSITGTKVSEAAGSHP